MVKNQVNVMTTLFETQYLVFVIVIHKYKYFLYSCDKTVYSYVQTYTGRIHVQNVHVFGLVVT